MAATATQQVIHNGPRNFVAKYTIGGTSGDLEQSTLVDASAVDATIGDDGLRLEKAEWVLTGFSCKLQWDTAAAGSDVDLIQLNEGFGRLDLSDVGGSKNNASNQSGDVILTTTGYTASGDGGHMILHFKKRRGIGFASAVFDGSVEPSVGSLTVTGEQAYSVGIREPGTAALTLAEQNADRTVA
jgi:hypothetical protein